MRTDPPCETCGGLGEITLRPCDCGRPVVWVYGEFECCNAPDCRKEAYTKSLAAENVNDAV